jgi:predicted N-formylglutamate amidohydrolase
VPTSKRKSPPYVLITCEHGGNRIPAKYLPLFKPHRQLLESHRGFDPGALTLARDFAAACGAALVYSTTSRLLVELNRSPGHPQLFSKATARLSPAERERLLARYYRPYRESVEALVREACERGRRVMHVSCHSFTPVLDGETRRADVGLLYDPKRATETAFCLDWQRELMETAPELVVRRNYPYRGYGDGLTTYLRKRFADPLYCGTELEVNQKYPLGDAAVWRKIRKVLLGSVQAALGA